MPFDAAALKQKVGPLPLYAWGGIGAAGLAVLVLLMRKKGAGTAVTAPGATAPALDSSGVGAYTSGGGGSPYSYGNTYVCPDGSYASSAALCPPANTPPVSTTNPPTAPTCPSGQIYVNGSGCIDPTNPPPSAVNCPTGQTYVPGAGCVSTGGPPTSTPPTTAPPPAPACPVGEIYVIGQGCINPGAHTQCAPGYYNNGYTCLPETPHTQGCPSGTVLLPNGQCGVLPFGANSSLQHQALGVGSGTAALFSV